MSKDENNCKKAFLLTAPISNQTFFYDTNQTRTVKKISSPAIISLVPNQV